MRRSLVFVCVKCFGPRDSCVSLLDEEMDLN